MPTRKMVLVFSTENPYLATATHPAAIPMPITLMKTNMTNSRAAFG